MADITWTNETRHLSELLPWEQNPRQIRVAAAERLAQSLDEFAQVEPIIIGPGNELYNGHQRLKVWADKFGDIEVQVRVASRKLTAHERKRLTILLHQGAVGEWDFDALADGFEAEELLEWGFDDGALRAMQMGVSAMNVLLDSDPKEVKPPSEFPEYSDDLPYDYTCPKCGYHWSGKQA